jgi:hypothetical protein
VLSVREREADKVAALDAGADDYVTKPFGINELQARLRAAIHRASLTQQDAAVIQTPDFRVDLAAKQVTRNGTEVRLTPTEWQLVESWSASPAGWSASGSCCKRYGAKVPGGDQLPAPLHRPDPAQAGTRSSAPALLHHRTRHGLPVPTQGPTKGARPTTAT